MNPPFSPQRELAERLGLSEATLVRFARTLDFSSYPAMREVLQETFRRRVTHSVRLRGRLDDLREAGDIFERLIVSEIDFLTLALESVDREFVPTGSQNGPIQRPSVCIWGRAFGGVGRIHDA